MALSPSVRLRRVLRHLAVAASPVEISSAWRTADIPVGISAALEIYCELFSKMDVALLPKVFHPQGHMVWYDNEDDLSTLKFVDYTGLEKMCKRFAGGGPLGTVTGKFVGHFHVGKNIVVTMLHDWPSKEKLHWHTNLVWVNTADGWRILSKAYTTVPDASTAYPTTWISNDALPAGISDGMQWYMKMFTDMDAALLPKVFHSKGHMSAYQDESSLKTLWAMDLKRMEKMCAKAGGKNPEGEMGGGIVGHYCVGKDIVVTMLHDSAGSTRYHTNLVWTKAPDGWRVISKAYTTLPS